MSDRKRPGAGGTGLSSNHQHKHYSASKSGPQDYREQFREFAHSKGFELPREIIADGKRQPFSTNGKRGNDTGRYWLHLDGVPNGTVWDWRGGEYHWVNRDQKLSAADRKRRDEETRQAKATREAEQVEKHAKAAAVALCIWNASTPAREDHPYLVRKGIPPRGFREYQGELVFRVECDGKLVGLQFIGADGCKRFLPGTKKKGAYSIIGELRSVL